MERLPEHQIVDVVRSGCSGEAASTSSQSTGCGTTSDQSQTTEPRARVKRDSKSYRLSPLALLPPIEPRLHRPPSSLGTAGTATPRSRASRASSHVPTRSPSVSTLTSTSTSLHPSKALSSSASTSTSASASASTSTTPWKPDPPRFRHSSLNTSNRTSGAYVVGVHTMNNVRTGLPRWTHGMAERMQAGEWEWDRGWMGVVAEGQREEDKVSGKKSSKPGGNTGRNTGRGTGGQESVKPGGKKRSDGKEGRGRLMRLFTGGRK